MGYNKFNKIGRVAKKKRGLAVKTGDGKFFQKILENNKKGKNIKKVT